MSRHPAPNIISQHLLWRRSRDRGRHVLCFQCRALPCSCRIASPASALCNSSHFPGTKKAFKGLRCWEHRKTTPS